MADTWPRISLGVTICKAWAADPKGKLAKNIMGQNSISESAKLSTTVAVAAKGNSASPAIMPTRMGPSAWPRFTSRSERKPPPITPALLNTNITKPSVRPVCAVVRPKCLVK